MVGYHLNSEAEELLYVQNLLPTHKMRNYSPLLLATTIYDKAWPHLTELVWHRWWQIMWWQPTVKTIANSRCMVGLTTATDQTDQQDYLWCIQPLTCNVWLFVTKMCLGWKIPFEIQDNMLCKTEWCLYAESYDNQYLVMDTDYADLSVLFVNPTATCREPVSAVNVVAEYLGAMRNVTGRYVQIQMAPLEAVYHESYYFVQDVTFQHRHHLQIQLQHVWRWHHKWHYFFSQLAQRLAPNSKPYTTFQLSEGGFRYYVFCRRNMMLLFVGDTTITQVKF